MSGLGWAWQVAVPGVGESSPGPMPQQEASTTQALYIQNGRGLGREGQAVPLVLSAPTWASTGLLGRGGVGWELSVPGPAGTLRAGQRSARPHPAPHRSLRPGEPWGSPAHRVLPSLSCGMPCASQRTEEEARSVLRQQRESQLSHSTNGPQPPHPQLHKQLFQRAQEAGRGPTSPGGWAVGLLLHAASPAPKPRPTAFDQRGPPAPAAGPPPLHHPHVCWEPMSWERPPTPSCPSGTQGLTAGWGGSRGNSAAPFPGPPPYTPLESTSWAGRNHQRGPPPNGSTELTLDNEGLRRKGR